MPVALARPADLPHWRNPPIDEVAVAVQFNEISGLQTTHFGKLAVKLEADGYTETTDKGQLPPKFEVFGKTPELNQIQIQAVETPLPRVWYISSDKHRLVQFQADRFIYNWRRVKGAGTYPRLEHVLDKFFGAYEALRAFLSDDGLPELVVNQAELSYFNEIEVDDEDTFANAFSRTFKIWAAGVHSIQLSDGGAVEPERVRFISSQIVRNAGGTPIGRVHIDAQSASRDSKRVLRFSLVFRGPIADAERDTLTAFFGVGREAVVRTFDAVISDEMHRAWGRYQGARENGHD